MLDYVIRIKNISKTFDTSTKKIIGNSGFSKIRAIDNISLDIEKGKVVGIIGQNGSGKTTLLRLIAGILYPDSGTIVTKGKIGPLLQVGAGSNEELTVMENIIMQGVLLGFKKKWIVDKVPEIIKFAELEDYKNEKMKHLSSGMKVRIMFSTAMQIDPDILLVDEVIAVGDLKFRQKSYESFLSFKNRNKTIVFVSHNLQSVQKLCDVVYFLDKGKIVDYGEPEKVIKSYQGFCKIEGQF